MQSRIRIVIHHIQQMMWLALIIFRALPKVEKSITDNFTDLTSLEIWQPDVYIISPASFACTVLYIATQTFL